MPFLNAVAEFSSSRKGILLRAHSSLNISRHLRFSSGTVVVCALPMSRWSTGHFFDQSHDGLIARPSNSLRSPQKSDFNVDTTSDLPNRRRHATKNWNPTSPDAIA